MASTPKRKGQHDVHAVIQVYSDEGAAAIHRLALGPTAGATTISELPPSGNGWRLMQVHWVPRPSHNEWNTEHDFRQKLNAVMDGRWYDIRLVEYSWKPV